MSGQIFISYRREESRWSARSLHDRLCRDFDPKQIFMDVDAKAIPLGANFKQVIEKGVADSDVLIAVIGNNWLSTTDDDGGRRLDNPEDFVRLEIATALKREICIIPLLVDGAKMPRSPDLPEELRSLVWLNALSITAGTYFDVDCQRLTDAIRQVLEKLAAQEQERLATEQREREEKQRLEEEKERLEAAQREKERLEAEQREKERLEAERLEKERLETEQREKERLEAERLERERLEAEQRAREEKQRQEAERLEAQRLETERLLDESREKDRLEAEQRQRESTSNDKTIPPSPPYSQDFEPVQAEKSPIPETKGSTKQKPPAYVAPLAGAVLILIFGLIWFSGSKLNNSGREPALVTPITTPESTPIPEHTPIPESTPIARFTPVPTAMVSPLSDASFYYNRGLDFYNKNDYDRAISDFNEAIRLDPNYADAYYRRGTLYRALGKKNQAKADLAKAKELGYTESQ